MRKQSQWSRPAVAATAIGVVLAALGACSTIGNETSVAGPCLDDSKACVETRTGMVAALVADQDRSWISKPADRAMAASGVRLFAYQTVKDGLNCQQLAAAIQDLSSSRNLLAAGRMGGQTAERHNQIKALTHDTEVDYVSTARRKSCKA
jgi:hypothetical protein